MVPDLTVSRHIVKEEQLHRVRCLTRAGRYPASQDEERACVCVCVSVCVQWRLRDTAQEGERQLRDLCLARPFSPPRRYLLARKREGIS